MNTQTLQHTLSQLLHTMQNQMAELEQAISDIELRLRRGKGRPQAAQAPAAKGGGRRSAGWTEAARAQVAARMRAYWQAWREQQALPAGPQDTAGKPQDGAREQTHPVKVCAAGAKAEAAAPQQPRATGGRSTAGWTPQARAQAAARMRARWRGHKQGMGLLPEGPCG